MKKVFIVPIITFLIAITAGCINTATFDEEEYNKTLALKQETLDLIGKATEPYASHEAEVAELLQKLNSVYESSQARPNNKVSVKQWKLMLDEDANLIAGFFARWKSEGTLNKFFIEEAKGVISKGFNTITDLEEAKKT